MVKRYSNETNQKESNSNTLSNEVEEEYQESPTPYIYSKALGRYVLANEEERLIKQKETKKEIWDDLFSNLLEDSLQKIRELFDYHQEQLLLIQKSIENHIAFLQILANHKTALEEAKGDFEEYGRFELDKSGKLKNVEAEELLQEWEAKTKTTVDRKSPETYYVILQILNEIEEQEEKVHVQLEKDDASYEYHKEQRDKARELIDQLERGDTVLQEEAVNEIKELSIHQKRHFELDAQLVHKNTHSHSETAFTKEDLEMSAFDFGFAPIKEDFNSSMKEEEQEPGNKEEKPSIEHIIPTKAPSI